MLPDFAPFAMVRTAGLSVDDLQGFQTEHTLAVARQADDILGYLTRERDALCERIHQTIAGQRDAVLRRALLKAKRNVHNFRAVDVASIRTSGLLPGSSLVEQLERWTQSVTAYALAQSAGATAIEQDMTIVRSHMAALWHTSSVRRGILFAQPLLFEMAERSKSSRTGWTRKVETAIAAYCFRAATKTSPFSTFTEVGIGCFNQERRSLDDLDALHQSPGGKRARVFINAAFVQRVVDLIVADPKCRNNLPVVASSPSYSIEECVHYLTRHTRSSGEAGEGEILRSLRRTPAIGLSLQLVHDDDAFHLTPGRLAEKLAARTGVALSRATTLVEGMLECGLLEVRLNFTANDLRAVSGLATLMRSLPSSQAQAAGDKLALIQPLIDKIGDSADRQAAGLVREVGAAASATLAALGSSPPTDLEPVVLRNNVVREELVELPTAAFELYKPALARLASTLPLFDAEASMRCRVRDAFIRRFGETGECSNILELFEVVSDEAHTSIEATGNPGGDAFGSEPSANPRHDPVVAKRTAMMRAMRAHSLGRRHAELPASFWIEWAASARELKSNGFLPRVTFAGQVAPGQNTSEPRQLVLNKVLPGNAMAIAHYAATAETKAQEWLRDTLRRYLPTLVGDADPVDLIGTFAFDGVIRPRLLTTALIYPGESTTFNAKGIIDWADLLVTIDKEHDDALVLRRKSTGRRIAPIHLGTLGTLHLPPFYRFLKSLGPAFAPEWSAIDYFEAFAETGVDEVRHYGRIVDENVVISRETWCIPMQRVPRCGTGESEFQFYRRLRKWASEIGLPQRVYVTPMRTHDYLRSDLPAQSFRRAHKPFYVDWDGLLSHRLFQRFASVDQGTLTISEALPDYIPDGRRSRAAEYILELDVH